ncbi:restriction endonuclease subunit S [Photobacterium damselae]
MTKQMSVPTLRFGEYVGDWHSATVGQLVKDGVLVKPLDGNHGNIHPKASDYVESGIPFLMASDIRHGQADLQGCKFIDKDLADSLQKGFACEGDVLLTHKGTVGETTILEGIKTPYVMLTPQVTYYRVKNSEKLDNRFLQKLFMSESFRKELLMKADSGTRPYIGILGQLTLNLTSPEIEEQQKIASFLSKVDEKISLLTMKKTKLTEYKKGVMQQLFNGKWQEQDGQLTFIPPTLRFKAGDGSEFPDWEERKLADLGSFIGGGTPDTKNADYWAGETPWISSSDVIEGNIFQIERSRFITDEAIATSATKIVPANSILIVSRVGVGKFVVSKHEICTSQDFSNFTPEQTDVTYMAYNLYVNKHKLEGLAQGTSIKGFTTGDLKSLRLGIPCIEEQTKIANFLSAIDQKIDLANSELEKAKEWKKGLLQQMFV